MEDVGSDIHWIQAAGSYLAVILPGLATVLAIPAQKLKTHVTMAAEVSLKVTKELEAPFLKALDENQGIMVKICRAYCNTREDEEDLYQEIVFQLWKAFPSYDGNSKLSTWMYSVALRTAIKPFRVDRSKVEIRETLPDRAEETQPIDERGSEKLFSIFHRLSIYERAILALMMEGFTQKEIATLIGLHEKTVTKQMRKIKETVNKQ